ncbi:LLM class F420-dependent oxidoreductase [Streptomyces paromomycinus]|uniref:LLM class F420-dependent oxidoreductase n=2 Tax=Streptomyces paromomycinus TaxID=92743 RepID=A0A401W632_STREY|nr:LLM class F420-dependent oxidoreductase [Streptomyces paromomycinus]
MATGQPVIAGFGPGAKQFQRGLLGASYTSPLTAAREYLTVIRRLLDGDIQSAREGEYFGCGAELAAFPAPRVDIGLGVLRPGMARLAGEIADVAITWLTPASYLRETVVPALREGAEAAGRPVPRLTAIVPLALNRPGHTAAEVALASNAAHIRAPHYIDMLRRSGVDVAGDDPLTHAAALIKGGAFLSGDLLDIAAQLADYRVAGVDEVVLNVTGVCNVSGPQAAMEELKTLLAELA